MNYVFTKMLKRLADIRPSGVDKNTVDGEEPVRLCNYMDVYKNGRITGDLPFMQASASAAQIDRFGLCRGDVLITKDSETPNDIAVPAVVEASAEGVLCGYHLALLRPRSGVDGGFLAWALRSKEVAAQFTVRAQGVTRYGLTTVGLGTVMVPIPENGHQQAIAAFLDRETAKIDALVAEQERLLVLLEEKRQAVIANAVTKGLDLTVPMKDSGVEWLGQVPAHWSVVRLAYYASIENGSTPNRNDLRYWDEGDIPWVGSGEVNQYIVNEPSEYVTALALDECSLRVVPKGAVLVGLVGQGRTRAMSALLGINAAINQNVAAVIAGERLMPAFLHYSLQAAYEHLRECARGGNQAALNCQIISAFRIAIPPIQEQELIAAHLDAARHAVECLATESRRSISLLNERRAALVSAAVTGKLDVLALIPATEPALAAE